MAVTGVGSAMLPTLQALSGMRNQLDDLQKQLASGLKSDTYAGLGLDRGLTVGLRSQLAAIQGYQQSNTLVGVRLELMQTALTEFDSVSQQARGTIAQSQFTLNGGSQTTAQVNAVNVLDQLLGTLNTSVDGRYLFSGNDVTQPPVDTADHILNGDGTKAGLKQLIAERKQADLGGDGLGRLSVGAPGATSVSLTEDAAPPFGFKLAGATTTMAGATVSGPTGSPASLTFDIGATNPSEGDTVKFSFNLPDGTTADLTLTATTASPPGFGQFTIGATPGDTATSLKAALTAGLQNLGSTQLAAASAVAAGNDFFSADADHPPQRVGGSPPFYGATTLVDGSATTVQWYKGDAAANDPRTSVTARIDDSVSVAYGARANEEALRKAVQSVAVFAATSYSGSTTDQVAYNALQQRLSATLSGGQNQQKISDIGGQLATAQVALQNTKDRQDQTNTTLGNLLQNVQGAPSEQVAMQLLTLQTSLQATMQTTAMLLKTSLVNYL
ncbi:MAG TPA: flagellar biosynthesis protein FlgL [Xanthobacteraceae bacterium]|nr:flagellar biosynthesis protein FlgL [Xanthobacteraceae bacterium]